MGPAIGPEDATPAAPPGLAAYGRLLRTPGTARATLIAFVARLPLGMAPLALVLFVESETSSYGAAGIVAGAFTLGVSITGPALGRLADRHGAGPLLIFGGTISAVSLAAVVGFGAAHLGLAGIAAAAALAGAAMPPLNGIVRQRWTAIADEASRSIAQALESVMVELLFVCGPLLCGLLASTLGPGSALLVASACSLAGTLGLASLPRLPAAATGDRDRLRTSRALWLLIAAGVPMGASFGALDVFLPAFGAAHGDSSLGAVCLAALGCSSIAGGLAYGTIRQPPFRTLSAWFVSLAVAQAVVYLPLLLAGNVVTMLALMVLAGCCVAPWHTARNQLAHLQTSAAAATETFSWVAMTLPLGVGIGSGLTGALVQGEGWRVGPVVAFGFAAASAALSFGSSIDAIHNRRSPPRWEPR